MNALAAAADRAVTSHDRPLLFYFGRGSIWKRTRSRVFAFTVYAFSVWALSRIGLAPNVGTGAASLTSILAMVTGLMVSYRSSSSNDRWGEGRRIWAAVTSATRSLQRTLVYAMPPRGHVDQSHPYPIAAANEQRDERLDECLALIVGYSYALKHHLRDEHGYDFLDLKPFLPSSFVASLVSHSSPRRFPKRAEISEASREHSAANTDPAHAIAHRGSPKRNPRGGNLPLAILARLHMYLNQFRADGEALDTPAWATCIGMVKELTEALTSAERIRDTPIPLALGVHLQQIITLYVATIPPQLAGPLGLWVVPVTALAAFTFFGVDRISEELSDPFGIEPNDLPLDRFCADIRREWLELVGEAEDPLDDAAVAQEYETLKKKGE